jgi:hypothetical protein
MNLFLSGHAEQIKNFVAGAPVLALFAAMRYRGRMLTVVIETLNDDDALAATLAALVPAAVEGLVREVIVHDRGSSDATVTISDQAGCILVGPGGLGRGLKAARGTWLLLLEPGALLGEGWMEAAANHVGTQRRPARFSPARRGVLPRLKRLFARTSPLADGVLVSKAEALSRYRPVAHGLRRCRLNAAIGFASR